MVMRREKKLCEIGYTRGPEREPKRENTPEAGWSDFSRDLFGVGVERFCE